MPEVLEKTETEQAETGHWTETVTHEKLSTPEAKQILSKFKTPEDGLVGYIELQKSAGRPFKLPETLDSVDKWPDKKDQEGFRSGINKLLGVVEKPEDLKDFNFALGMVEGGKVNETISGEFSKFIVDNKMPKGLAQKAVEFYNQLGEKFKQIKAQQDEAQFLQEAKECDEKLLADPNIGTPEKLQVADELVRRMFQNNLGLTADEYKEVADDLVNANFTRRFVLRKALHAAARQLAKEGTHEAGQGGGKQEEKPVTIADQLPNTAKALGWK